MLDPRFDVLRLNQKHHGVYNGLHKVPPTDANNDCLAKLKKKKIDGRHPVSSKQSCVLAMPLVRVWGSDRQTH